MSGNKAGLGHNSNGADLADSGVAAQELKSFVERIQRLEEEKKALAEDIKDVFSEAKGRGYDIKVLRVILKRIGEDRAERQEFDAIFELYARALGMDFMI